MLITSGRGDLHTCIREVFGKEFSEAEIEGRRQLRELFFWLRKSAPGFENAKLLSMAAQIATPILSGWLLEHVGYHTLFPYAAIFVALAFVTMLLVRHGDTKVEAKMGLEAFDND